VKEIAEDDEGVANITAESLLQEGDYVFCVVDNYAARKLVFDAAAKLNNIDVFTGGNDEALYGSVYHYHRRDGRDITSHPGVYHDEFVNPDDKNPGELSCQERAELDGGTQLLAVNMAVASALLAKAAHVIFGTEDQKAKAIENAEIFFDLSMCEMSSSDRRTEEAILPVPAL
jgi:molybdopterin/thiamine biosynthesis adenylyltransferase